MVQREQRVGRQTYTTIVTQQGAVHAKELALMHEDRAESLRHTRN